MFSRGLRFRGPLRPASRKAGHRDRKTFLRLVQSDSIAHKFSEREVAKYSADAVTPNAWHQPRRFAESTACRCWAIQFELVSSFSNCPAARIVITVKDIFPIHLVPFRKLKLSIGYNRTLVNFFGKKSLPLTVYVSFELSV